MAHTLERVPRTVLSPLPGAVKPAVVKTSAGRPPLPDASAYIREFLSTYPPEELNRKTVDPETRRTWFEKMCMNIARIAISPTHPLAVSAYNALADRAWGKPKPSGEELDAIKGQKQFQIVFVPRAEIDPEIKPAEPKVLPEAKFIDAEVREDE